MEDTTASSVVKVFKNDKGKTSKTLGRVVSIVAMSSGRPKISILKVLDYLNIFYLQQKLSLLVKNQSWNRRSKRKTISEHKI